ncbi:S53 family peptidase [Arthrobacter sp. SDTb3-6]|uniref:S53 family peptidase n=1 Tax=Arthrobacter sp. SDTb3-6 TaxID=2713571 RepID=UPI00159E6DFB|nr:S53 family peptidase [Arthrobacter sp. SDTb3-6]NVN00574.1 S8 family serine peptidase [Arthrobacter sp. SDTb3-6]
MSDKEPLAGQPGAQDPQGDAPREGQVRAGSQETTGDAPRRGRHAAHDSGPELVALPGSSRGPAPQALHHPAGAGTQDELYREEITVTVVLRRAGSVQAGAPGAGAVPDGHGKPRAAGSAIPAAYAAAPADVDLAVRTFTGLGATVVETDPASRRLRVSGPVGLLCTIFGTDLDTVSSVGPNNETSTHRHRTGELSVPAALDGVVTAVLGLDDRPSARAPFHFAPAAAGSVSYTPLDLGRIYNFPANTDGTGQVIAIIELGGGFGQSDLDTYFSELGITGPSVQTVSVDGAVNVPGGDPQGADGEVLLDIEVAGALAPGAAQKVYFAPNTDAGFLDAVSKAIHDTPAPAAISISWGQSEDQWTAQARTAMDDAFVDAGMLGITVTAAAGDNGSADAERDGKNHADFPASSPHVLACGGTRLEVDTATGNVTSETVWNDSTSSATGGGVSDAFPLPSWQQQVTVLSGRGPATTPKGRGVPDVAAVADPQTGYRVRVDGTDMVIGGTSAVAPLWAALVARLVQSHGRGLGQLQPVLYAAVTKGQVAPGFRDITVGNNGSYQATPGWDACTGLGVPDGTSLLSVLSGSPAPATGS